ncbi:MAG: hypothetical protein GXP15_08240 [Gammaproteobacteria bacterium]|nr:hypothetical protein [Gammaproteobacteria bacterium]
MRRTTITLGIMALFGVGPILFVAVAQAAAESLPPQIAACASERDVMVRLSCYDREVAALVALSPEPATVSSPAVRQTVSATLPPDAAAAVLAPVARVEPAPKSQAEAKNGFGFDPRVENISATVVKIRKQPYGELLIWLDNDQVWEQDQLDRRFKLRIGETVNIKKGTFTGYRLSGDSNRSIQVTRRK